MEYTNHKPPNELRNKTLNTSKFHEANFEAFNGVEM